MKKAWMALAVGLFSGVSVLAMLGTSSAQQADPISLEMRYSEAKFQMVDEAPKMSKKHPSESPGDTVIARGWLRDDAGEKAGRVHSTFVVTGGKSPKTTELATGVLALSGGQIVLQGVIGSAETDTLSIVGGSGDYAGANGTVEIVSGKTAVEFTINFTE
jgi:hypothetical protein